MHGKRQSTNMKLESIINSKTEEVDSDDVVKLKEKLAKINLRRACLYGGGARTILPKTKKGKRPFASPFKTSGGSIDTLPSQPLVYSAPPGAHEELFRMVQNPTKANLADADRVCINTSSMKEGLTILPQPRWYVGYNNAVEPPDTTMLIAANRYGFRGTKKILQYQTKPYELPSKTRNDQTPKFLKADDGYVDEYAPPIILGPVDSVNGMETPKLWPQNAEYANGIRYKKPPTMWKYKRETTVYLPERPKSPSRLESTMETTLTERETINEKAKLESTGSFVTGPLASQKKFEDTWKEKLWQNATSSLRRSMKELKEPYEAHTLMDRSDFMRYSGSTALIVHSQTTEEFKFRLRMDQSNSKFNSPLHLKWTHVIEHFDNISRKLKRGQSMTETIIKVAEVLQEVAMEGGSETSIRRIDFVKACANISFFAEMLPRQMSQLYSAFDPLKKDSMRFVELIIHLAVLDKPVQAVLDKLTTLWNIANTYGLDRSMFDIALDILTCCSASLDNISAIEELFREEFRLRCYEFAVLGRSKAHEDGVNASRDSSRIGTAASSKPSTATNSIAKVPSGEIHESQEFRAPGTASSKRSSNVQHQYNVCENYLNEETFSQVLKACPKLLKTFDQQLSERLIQCYGKDERYVVEPEEIQTENLDFTWIMKKSSPVEKVQFGLF